MIYFIPAWYQQGSWSEQEQIWYRERQFSEFDDTVKQIQLFHRRTKVPYQMISLGYTPNLRHLLHRQSIFHAPYWSCFDAIQEIQTKKIKHFSYHDLAWPEGTEFLYTPFCFVAMLKGEKYAQIEFGEIGNLIVVDLFNNGERYIRNVYDDRGFVSSSIVYENGRAVYQDFYTDAGVHKCRFHLESKQVDVNPDCMSYLIEGNGEKKQFLFEKTHYDSFDEMIYEVLFTYVNTCTLQEDIFCQAMHPMHARILHDVLKDRRTILSFFEMRYTNEDIQNNGDILRAANYIVVDNKVTFKRICRFGPEDLKKIVDISPYDTREDEGISQQLSVQKVLVPVDHLPLDVFEQMVVELGRYALNHDKLRVGFFTRQTTFNRKQRLLKQAEDILVAHELPGELAAEESKHVNENEVKEQTYEQQFFVEQCFSELDVSKCMREQRILLNLCEEPELYLQVLSVSMGVPQICSHRNEFMLPQKNGLLLNDMEELPKRLDFYLNNLRNWNHAHISSFEVGKQYSTETLLQKWKEVLSSFGKNTSFADWI